MAQRIQLRRKKGWRKPKGAVVVTRPGPWGNPFRVVPAGPGMWTVMPGGWPVQQRTAQTMAVEMFRRALAAGELDITEGHVRDVLAGRDLACYCPAHMPCHADVLLDVANAADPGGIT